MKNVKRIVRDAEIDLNETGISRISFSSEKPCRDSVEIPRVGVVVADVVLRHTDEAIDWDWIKEGIPIRKDHFDELVARGLEPFVEDGKLVSNHIVWGTGEHAKEILADIKAGVIRSTSIEADYSLEDCDFKQRDDGVYDIVVNHWRPLAVAFVTIPADPSVGVNRSYKENLDGGSPSVSVETETNPPNIKQKEKNKMDTNDTAEIFQLCNKFSVDSNVARDYFAKGMTLDQVRADILEKMDKPAAPVKETDEETIRSMEVAEKKTYSLANAIRSICSNKTGLSYGVDAGFEREVSQELARKYGKAPKGIYVGGIARAFSTTEGTGLVPQTHRPQDYIDVLRSKLVLVALGAKVIPGLKGKVVIPKATADAVGYMVAEGANITGSTPSTGSIVLEPHTCGALVDVTRELLLNSAPEADGLMLDAITEVIARKIQSQVLNGDGISPNVSGLIPALSDKGVINDWKGVVGLEGAIANANVEVANAKWLTNPATFAALRAMPRNAAGGDTMVATMEGGKQFIADLEALTTSDLADGQAVIGDWSNLIIGLHSALDIIVDESTNSASGGLRLVGLQDFSVGNAGAERFAYTSKLGKDA